MWTRTYRDNLVAFGPCSRPASLFHDLLPLLFWLSGRIRKHMGAHGLRLDQRTERNQNAIYHGFALLKGCTKQLEL
jgi:hypothetical protein